MMIIIALFVAAVSVALIVREMPGPVLGWLGLPIAAVLAVGGAAGFYNSGYEAFWNGVNYVALLAFAAFVLGVAAEGLLAPGAAGQGATPLPDRVVPTT
jgi:hypothetical protein